MHIKKSIYILLSLLFFIFIFSSTAISKPDSYTAGSDQLEQTILPTTTTVVEEAVEEKAPTSTSVSPRRTATRTPRSTATARATSTSTTTYTPVPNQTTTPTTTPLPTTIQLPTTTPTATRRESAGANASIYIDSLQLRSGPSESSSIVGGVVKGQSYRVLNISEDGIWIRLAVDNLPGGWGWVPARYTSVKGDITGIAISNSSADAPNEDEPESSPDRSTPLPGDAVVDTNGSRLRVRSGPSGDTDIIDHVYDGDAHRVLERSSNGRWVRLELDDQPEGGWVSISYVKLGRGAPSPGQVASAVIQPTSTSTPVSTATIAATSTQVVVAPTPTWTAIPSTQEAVIGVAIVRTTGGSRLRVREEASTTALILGYAYSERSYNVLQKSTDGSWVQISVPGLSTPGWVSVDFLDISFR